MMRSPDLTALAAGVALLVLGALLLLDAAGRVHLGFAYAGPALVAAAGAILLAGGLERRRRGRG